jgi:hypothetical protein
VYLQPIIQESDYSHPKAKELEEKVWSMPASEVIGSVGFFLNRLEVLSKSKKTIQLTVLTRIKNLLQALIGLKGSVS